MGSTAYDQILIDVEPSFMNLTASAGRVPDNTDLTTAGLSCANPETTAEISIAENNATVARSGRRPPRATLKRGSVAFDLYLRSTGASGSFADTMFNVFDACFGKKDTSSTTYTASGWGSTTTVTLNSVTNLDVGMGFAFVSDGIKYVRWVKSIASTTVTFEPAVPASVVSDAPTDIRGGRTYAIGRDFAADSSLYFERRRESYTYEAFGCQGATFALPLATGEMATARVTLAPGYVVPATSVRTIGDTAEPPGTWLKFLNADLLINATNTPVRACNFNVNFAPKAKMDQRNEGGLQGWEMGVPEVTAEVELSDFDIAQVTAFNAQTVFSLLAILGTTANGSAVAVYMPAAHLAAFPVPGEADELFTGPLSIRADIPTGDAGDYDVSETNLVDTLFRVFFEAGS